ncbi:amidase [Rhizobium sp. CSW-27]|uniref:amidase n=1 Tax=Rhizobium sp. CSW-27 TaxID=2839985 RepID=UPI001C01EAC3|nr:amidase [Rhizobium sp. CSW-27]MBT9372285.1 amidase [Rhizobium sp. CSW-27]
MTSSSPAFSDHSATVESAAAALKEGLVTARQLTEAALARINDPEGEGARVHVRRNDQRARKLAEASDAIRAGGHVRSALEGLPISVKDLFDLAGETTLAGSVALKDHPPAAADAPVVQRLIAAGAVITGTTNMSEFAFSGIGINPHYGTPKNPFDRATGRVPGGSSSGAAVSVTDGMAIAAIGTDTGGSIRIPSALCGLTGFKPTARRVSTAGVVPLSTSLDSIGPLARSVACCALIDAVISGEGQGVPAPLPIRGLRLAVPQTVVLDAMDATVSAVFARTLSRLAAAGAILAEIEVPEFSEVAGIYGRGGLVAPEAYFWHRELLEKAGDTYDPRVRARILRGRELSAADYLEALAARADWQARVMRRLGGYDAVILPTVPVIAPEIAPLLADDAAFFAANGLVLRNSTLINFLDGCGLSLPCQAPGEAPVGLMVAGLPMQDRAILAAGLAIEAVLADGQR